MIIKQLAVTAVVAITLTACATNQASVQSIDEPDRYESVADYMDWLSALENELRNGEPRELSSREWDRFNRLMDQTARIFADYELVAELNEEERVAAFNTHEELTSLVMKDGLDPVRCRMEGRIGTNFKELRCTRRGNAASNERFEDWWLRQHHTINIGTRAEGSGIRQ